MEMGGVAPEQLFVDFVNSEWYDGRGNLEERLLDSRWRSEFLDHWHLGEVGTASASTLRSLMELRGALRTLVEEMHGGRPPSTAGLEGLASRLGSISMRLEIAGDPPTPSWTAVHASWTSVRAAIIRSCIDFLAGPARDRLRRCENEGCRWAFVDASRNRSRRWCDPAICGNVSKVRAYRERLRAR
jgi:predicted RNA-binding Zn ribbon-like protein